MVFVTNNSTKSRADYRKKLEGLGIPSTVVSRYQDAEYAHMKIR